MSFFEKWETAINNKDLDAMVVLMHQEWMMVMYSTGKLFRTETGSTPLKD